MNEIVLSGGDLDEFRFLNIVKRKAKVSIGEGALEKIQASRSYIEKRINDGEVMYGVNTGFGAFSDVAISKEDIEKLQFNLIRSHSAGIGDPFDLETTRAILLLRLNALLNGHSGVRKEVVFQLVDFLNHDILPYVPQQGSVGASGDLAPLAHIALALIGEGRVFYKGDWQPSGQVLSELGLKPLVLQAKEGLSLINGCQVMNAHGWLAALKAKRLLKLFDVAAALTLEVLTGTRNAFDPLISKTRAHRGEGVTANNMRIVLGESSEISQSHIDCHRVQDSYSLRCVPAVHGAAKDAIRVGLQALEIEANSSTDNPLVFCRDKKILSCGNFHGEPVAFQYDFMKIALSALASISECRIEKMINPNMSGLPAFLAPSGGLNSGHMITHVATASLVSENKVLSHPSSVDSIPTSADKEDHVSMGTIAARHFYRVVEKCDKYLSNGVFIQLPGVGFFTPT